MTVTECLARARKCAAMADKMSGEDKTSLLELAEAWLVVADEFAKQAKLDATRPDAA